MKWKIEKMVKLDKALLRQKIHDLKNCFLKVKADTTKDPTDNNNNKKRFTEMGGYYTQLYRNNI
jgi:hypothetical protein